MNSPTKNLPYFITWTAQNKAKTLPLESCDNDHFFAKNQKWINLSSISYQASFGLQNESIKKAMIKQMDSFSMASPKHLFKLKEDVSNELVKRTKGSYKCFYTQSGSEGIENAIKMARQVSSKKIILAQERSYHGATMGSLAITGDWRQENHLLPIEWTKRIPDPQNDPNGLQLEKFLFQIGCEDIAAICLETITGGNGVFAPSKIWYQKVMELKRKYGFFLILDEVVCAGHRTGPFMGHHHFKGLKPDFVVTAKAMTGGYFPLGALLVEETIAKHFNQHTLSYGLTNYAHPLGLAALNAVLKITKTPKFISDLKEREEILKDFIKQIKKRGLTCRQYGMLAAIELESKITIDDLFNSGIYGAIQNDTMILAPSLVINKTTLKKGLGLIGELVDEKFA